MPQQKPGKSEQVVVTPWTFIHAIERMLGETFVWDLAATKENARAPNFITPEQDSLVTPWPDNDELCWLNPPYGKIEPWVRKANAHVSCRTVMLLPASVGSNWFADRVFGVATVYLFRPRIQFVGHAHPYPKDLMLCYYSADFGGIHLLDWSIV